jgi:hypothetical protein
LQFVQSKQKSITAKMNIRFKTSTQVWKVVGVILLVCGLQLYGQQRASGAEAEAKAATITPFDVPGAGTGYGQGTFPAAINPAGAITGSYADASSFYHGFLRARNGTFTKFDPTGSTGTSPSAINPAGEITGNYTDANGTAHGFLRIPAHPDE